APFEHRVSGRRNQASVAHTATNDRSRRSIREGTRSQPELTISICRIEWRISATFRKTYINEGNVQGDLSVPLSLVYRDHLAMIIPRSHRCHSSLDANVHRHCRFPPSRAASPATRRSDG